MIEHETPPRLEEQAGSRTYRGLANAPAANDDAVVPPHAEPEDSAATDLPPPRWKPVTLEREILDVLDMAPEQGERLDLAFRRKEHQLASLFTRSSVMDCRALHKRISVPATDDPIAARFARLVPERRGRLLAFLADARRREALAGTRPR
ncbi:MAG: hypothetical protein WKG01_15200 [Kofleriaceae bacterium]